MREDVRGLGNSYEDEFVDKLHLRAEYRYSVLALRLGLNSGKPTFGLGIESNVVQIMYAFYGDNNRYTGETDKFHEIKFSVKLGHNRGIGYKKEERDEDEDTRETGTSGIDNANEEEL